MPAQTTDPFTTVVLVGFIVSLLVFISRMYEARIADRNERLREKDQRIEKLEAENKAMAESSASLAKSTGKMLDFFLDREPSHRPEETTVPRGREPS
jgi:hypothetical protein